MSRAPAIRSDGSPYHRCWQASQQARQWSSGKSLARGAWNPMPEGLLHGNLSRPAGYAHRAAGAPWPQVWLTAVSRLPSSSMSTEALLGGGHDWPTILVQQAGRLALVKPAQDQVSLWPHETMHAGGSSSRRPHIDTPVLQSPARSNPGSKRREYRGAHYLTWCSSSQQLHTVALLHTVLRRP